VATPFIAYGGHSLTALQLCTRVFAAFGKRPDLGFLMSDDCTVRALLNKMNAETGEDDGGVGCVVRLSAPESTGVPLLIFCAAGTSAVTYQPLVQHAAGMQIFAVELPGRGRRADEPMENDFKQLFAKLLPDVMQWAESHKRFFVWGDSLGAVLAYEFALRWRDTEGISVLGLCVSGNAGPTVAAVERGMGDTFTQTKSTGEEIKCVAEMTRDDWKTFFCHAAGTEEERSNLARMLEDDEFADSALGPLAADCACYESYTIEGEAARIRCPIYTFRGEHDSICSLKVIRSWKLVAAGRVEYREFKGAGHILVRDATKALARHLAAISHPDLSEHLGDFNEYRASYAKLREQGGASDGPWARIASPLLGAKGVPTDLVPKQLDLSPLDGSEVCTPQSKQVKNIRHGNLQWRLGNSQGNRMRAP